jgi:hypothetical protein
MGDIDNEMKPFTFYTTEGAISSIFGNAGAFYFIISSIPVDVLNQ